MMVGFAKTFMWLVRIGGENRWTLYDFDAVALCKMIKKKREKLIILHFW